MSVGRRRRDKAKMFHIPDRDRRCVLEASDFPEAEEFLGADMAAVGLATGTLNPRGDMARAYMYLALRLDGYQPGLTATNQCAQGAM